MLPAVCGTTSGFKISWKWLRKTQNYDKSGKTDGDVCCKCENLVTWAQTVLNTEALVYGFRCYLRCAARRRGCGRPRWWWRARSLTAGSASCRAGPSWRQASPGDCAASRRPRPPARLRPSEARRSRCRRPPESSAPASARTALRRQLFELWISWKVVMFNILGWL